MSIRTMLISALIVTSPKFPLTIPSIMRGPALVGHAPRGLRWSADGEWVAFSWAKADGSDNPAYKDYKVRRDGTGLVEGRDGFVPASTPSPDRPESPVFTSGGDLYLRGANGGEDRRLAETPETESDPRLVNGGKDVVYLIGNDVFRMRISDGKRTQLTYLSDGKGADGASAISVPAGFHARSPALSPTGKFAWFPLGEDAPTVRRADVPSYITSSGYPELISTYPRVGAPSIHSRGVIFDTESGKAIEVNPARPGRVFEPRWSPDGTRCYIVERADDHKDDWIVGIDPASDETYPIYTEHCDAWIGGPARGTIGWLPDSSRIYLVSENGGYANLLSVPAQGGAPTTLVGGNFEVSDVRLDPARNRFTFVSSEGSPFKRHLDTVLFDGTGKRKLADLSADEDSSYAIAPNGEDVAVVSSKPNRPPELFVGSKQVTTSPTEEWLSGPWIDPPIVMVPSTDGVQVPARLYRSPKWRKGGPAVIFVHGAGYLQNVYDAWSHYYREYMFHHFLMDRGYVVLDMDYRASAGYGRDWRTAIYRHMGGKDLDDIVSGAKWLVSHEGADKKRLGIYGGSYGGFMTLMAMFTKPGTFAAGAALRPVADWSTYNGPYTSDILNLPQDDKEAYRISSPINFVDGLQGSLLICHGMVDTNVTFQDSVRVAEKLIELGKTNWEIAPYPVENHDFARPSSWADEYRRIFELFERTIGHPGKSR